MIFRAIAFSLPFLTAKKLHLLLQRVFQFSDEINEVHSDSDSVIVTVKVFVGNHDNPRSELDSHQPVPGSEDSMP